MGVVYKAWDAALRRLVAIKRIQVAHLSSDEIAAYGDRLRNEARMGARLNHPGIASVYDLLEGEQAAAIVMELVEGPSLATMLRERRLKLGETLSLGLQVARALSAAHEAGVIHRDIKPANILVADGGEAKITDFGIAKYEGTQLSSLGRPIGTPAYMSPEQVTGVAVGTGTDVFSFGAVLYFMATGEKPFPGKTVARVAFEIANTEPLPPRMFDPTLPHSLEILIGNCLAKLPKDRPTSGEVAEQLQQLMREVR